MPVARSIIGRNVQSGSANIAVPGITLKQFWRQNVGVGNPPTLVTGSNAMTVTAGSTLVALWSGADNQLIGLPTDSAGTFVAVENADASGSDHISAGIAYVQNAAGGSHTITPQVIAVGGGGELLLWIYEVTNLPSTIVVRAHNQAVNAVSSAQSWSVASANGTPQQGDLVMAITTYENSVTLADAQLTDPPSGWTSLAASQDAATNLPTELCYQVLAASGAVSAAWSTVDTHKTEHIALMAVFAHA